MLEIHGWMEVDLIADGGASYVLDLDGERLGFAEERPSHARLLPLEPRLRLREWRRQRTASRWFGLKICDELRALPWAQALQVVLDDDPIAWIVPGRHARRAEPLAMEDVRLLLSVWDDPGVAGIKRELDGLASLGDRGIRTTVALGPTGDELAERLRKGKPSILHLALGAQASDDGPGLRYRDEASGKVQELRAADLVDWLPPETRLIVFNTCDATEMALEIARARGIMTLAWAGAVSDERARAFALFFYEQLLRGTSAAEAILMFTNQSVSSDADHRDLGRPEEPSRPPGMQNPVVFVRDVADLDLEIVLQTGRTTGRSTRQSGVGAQLLGSQRADASSLVRGIAPIQIETRDAINPAMLINGRDPLRAIRITSEHELPRTVIEVTCDAGIGVSQVRRMIDLVAGVTSVNVGDFQFPVLYELLRLGVKRRPVNFCIRLLADVVVLAEETSSSWWMAQDEWIDSSETHEFLPAFIDPESQTVKDLWASVDRRVIPDFDGETASERQTADVYVSALYQAIRVLKLNYIQPPPQRIGPQRRRLLGQRVRSPAEVVKDRRGTCHDLSLLFAACMEHIRLYPLVILIPYHTFVGYWQSSKAHAAYWKTARQWQILRKQELQDLVASGAIALLEATKVTEPMDVSFQDACRFGSANLDGPDPLDAAIDIRESRAFIDTLQ